MINKILAGVIAALLAVAYVLRLQNKNAAQNLKVTKDKLDAEIMQNDVYKKIDRDQRKLNEKHRDEVIAERKKLALKRRDQLDNNW